MCKASTPFMHNIFSYAQQSLKRTVLSTIYQMHMQKSFAINQNNKKRTGRILGFSIELIKLTWNDAFYPALLHSKQIPAFRQEQCTDQCGRRPFRGPDSRLAQSTVAFAYLHKIVGKFAQRWMELNYVYEKCAPDWEEWKWRRKLQHSCRRKSVA